MTELNKSILVTGGTGYIGSHTVVELIKAGYEIIIIDNLSKSSKNVVEKIQIICEKKIRFVELDLCDKLKLDEFFKNNKNISAIMHFAGLKSVGESVQEPLLYYRNNLLSLINILELMQEYNINNIVFSSSCSVYGDPDILPVNEKAKIKKVKSPYARTKQIGEEIISDLVNASNIKAIILRYFNPVGAHDSGLIGEYSIGTPSNLIPLITQTAIGKRNLLRINGNDYNTIDGTCVRDYIHVMDLAKAHVIATSRLLDNMSQASLEVFNIGTGKSYSILETIRVFEKISGKKINYEFGPRREGDIEQMYSDTSLANSILGWKAEKSFEEMLISAWEWEKSLMFGS